MKTNKILKMNEKEFEKELNEKNFDFIIEKYEYLWRGLEMYQDGARLSGEDDFLDVNEYFDIIKEDLKDLEDLKIYL